MNKDQVISYLSTLAEQVQEGEIDPIDGYIELYDIQKTASDMLKVIKDDAISRAENLNCDHIQKGYQVRTKSRTQYSYKHSAKWCQINQDKKTLESQMKFAYAHGEVANTESGELIEPAEAKTTTFIELTYKGDQ